MTPPLIHLGQTDNYHKISVRLHGSDVGTIDVALLPTLAAGVSAEKGTLVNWDGTYLVGTMEQLLGVNG